uniref:Uncharacterized protein n=1 Tax=Arundo donax TaxID=35708 RepID=A0A0A9DL70_ARUDO
MTCTSSAGASSRASSRDRFPSRARRRGSATGAPMQPTHLRPSGMEPIARSTQAAQYRVPQARHSSRSPRIPTPMRPPLPHLAHARRLPPPWAGAGGGGWGEEGGGGEPGARGGEEEAKEVRVGVGVGPVSGEEGGEAGAPRGGGGARAERRRREMRRRWRGSGGTGLSEGGAEGPWPTGAAGRGRSMEKE